MLDNFWRAVRATVHSLFAVRHLFVRSSYFAQGRSFPLPSINRCSNPSRLLQPHPRASHTPVCPAPHRYIMGAPTDEATKLKDQGNNAFRNQEWDKALEFYTKAIEAYNAEPSFYTNRAQVRSLTCCIHASANLLPDIHQARTIWLRHTRCRHGN